MTKHTNTSPQSIDLMTTEQAARYLGVSAKSLHTWRCEGTGPVYSQHVARGLVRYRRADIDEWLAANCIRSTSEAGARAKANPANPTPRKRSRRKAAEAGEAATV
jgi:hypothetical protein